MHYIHGSSDSTDIDIVYVLDYLPNMLECKAYCDGKGNKNGNIIVIKDGIVVETFKGCVDEVNNGILRTYPLHKQEYPLLITRQVKRDVILKDVRVVRKIVSAFSRTEHRKIIKETLRKGWKERVNLLKTFDYKSFDFTTIKKTTKEDTLKSFAFQIGQALALHDGVELYTKKEIGNYFPDLNNYLQRKDTDITPLVNYIVRYATLLESIPTKQIDSNAVYFGEPYNACYDINNEVRL